MPYARIIANTDGTDPLANSIRPVGLTLDNRS
jgi:hypothetical protein